MTPATVLASVLGRSARVPAFIQGRCGRIFAHLLDCRYCWNLQPARFQRDQESPGNETEHSPEERRQSGDQARRDRPYRAIVVHSDAHDQRRLKRLAKATAADRQKMQKHLATLGKQVFFCRPDAQQAARAKVAGDFHRLDLEIVEQPVYAAGRPRQDGSKPIKATRYVLAGTIVPEAAKVVQLQQKAGCFVLLTNRSVETFSPAEILKLYKDQHYIEQNFAFLKDPVIINEIFLKKPERIKALGLIFVLALMIWRLIDRTIRQTLQENQDKVPGWDR